MEDTVYRGRAFSRSDVLRAFDEFDRNVRSTFPDSRFVKYAISHAGKWYPPKEILRLATRCEARNFVLGGGPNINRCFEQLGFTIVEDWATASIQKVQVHSAASMSLPEYSAEEGREALRQHKRRERNRSLVIRKKRSAMAQQGCLKCEVCDFDFAQVYGLLGEGFAECHHREPLSLKPGKRSTTLDDLAIVCSNCHRMLHRRPWHTVEELREMVLALNDTNYPGSVVSFPNRTSTPG